MENESKEFFLDTLRLMAATGESELTLRKLVLQFLNAHIIENKDIALINYIIENRVNKQ